jgi:hypothetical protein
MGSKKTIGTGTVVPEVPVQPANKLVTFETMLRCKLTDAEMLSRGTEMAWQPGIDRHHQKIKEDWSWRNQKNQKRLSRKW